jgi:hypothetical protein
MNIRDMKSRLATAEAVDYESEIQNAEGILSNLEYLFESA